MQISHTVPPVRMFSEYLYFSSFSDQMLRHAAEAASRYIREKSLGPESLVVEVASNDGYMLKNFEEAAVPNVGFEPATNVAEAAHQAGIETLVEFFGERTASALLEERGPADLILANNVFAHAPEPNDFVAGIQTLLAPDGWAVLEFPYGGDMLNNVEFDTIYHEHVFYFTLAPLTALLERHRMEAFHVEHLDIHGGSLRLFVAHRGAVPIRSTMGTLLSQERSAGVQSGHYYDRFSQTADRVRDELAEFLEAQQAQHKRVAAYGASAKGSTLLNYVGEIAGTIEFIADRSTYKHGRLSPGLHIPIVPAEALADRGPDYAVLLAWNFAEEIIAQQRTFVDAGGRFVVPLPELRVVRV